ncbi:hypothetical protein IGI04_019197 [Brassica rapa subsp. trilocularis]|uniref:Calponin-homology (CH) domain-containing protein n=1 Tax=Brassica rapa subsp. trilocularis TaxID=1813537 RepID=A0ABQ7MF58_BRACM|nr:hypothetical protein IGI04_019197 [Brassica rapa subsp. trilocularis]
MSGVGVIVSDPWLQSQLTQVELRSLNSKMVCFYSKCRDDERAINMKRVLNPWERNENHTLCLNSVRAVGCSVVNIGTHDMAEGRIQLLADLSLKKMASAY